MEFGIFNHSSQRVGLLRRTRTSPANKLQSAAGTWRLSFSRMIATTLTSPTARFQIRNGLPEHWRIA
jgi:hypothetical protein